MHQTQFLLKGLKEEGWIRKLEVSFNWKLFFSHIGSMLMHCMHLKFEKHLFLMSESFHNFTADNGLRAYTYNIHSLIFY